MNRFLIDHHPDAIAKSLCDQHIVKMPLEEAQMLCTAIWHYIPEVANSWGLYKPVHQKHPCTLWAMETRANFEFSFSLYVAMLKEYTHRYGKVHGAANPSKHNPFVTPDNIIRCKDYIPEGQLTPHPQCFSGHDHLKTDENWPIVAYRAFYVVDKSRFARYNKGRNKPQWMIEGEEILNA